MSVSQLSLIVFVLLSPPVPVPFPYLGRKKGLRPVQLRRRGGFPDAESGGYFPVAQAFNYIKIKYGPVSVGQLTNHSVDIGRRDIISSDIIGCGIARERVFIGEYVFFV